MPHSGQVNPVKHSRELKRIAEQAGAQIFEQTPVLDIEDKETFFILKLQKERLELNILY